MRFRQIHLDFHTSGLIPGIGTRFDANKFASAYKDAYVDSVTLFAKCHHGYSYHPTDVGTTHPHLDFDLLRGQVDALHGVGIKAPIYLTATWDELSAFEHPEWRTVSPDGSFPMFHAEHGNGVGWAFLDFSSPYVDHLCAQTEEVMQKFPDADGIFMDIWFQLPSISTYAKMKMEAEGLDWTNAEHRERFTGLSLKRNFARIRDSINKYNPKMPLYFNSPHMPWELREDYKKFYSHVELESLPTSGWGYDHFPLSARFADTLDQSYLGMTGKFHTHWGEVGGYKKPEALVYECGAMLAHGARCSIGDHLHPTAQIDQSSMDIIAPAYKWVAEREAWTVDSTNRADIALLVSEAVTMPPFAERKTVRNEGDQGAVRVLLEGKFAFDVVDLKSDYSSYRLLILPDVVPVDAELKAKIDAFVAGGGKVLLTGKSGIDAQSGFQFAVGAKWHETSPHVGGDFALPIEGLRSDFVNDPLLMYKPVERIELIGGEDLGAVYEPYFDRAPRHFSGHVNAPSKPDPEKWALGSEKGAFIYFAFPIFSAYQKIGAVAIFEIAEKLIDRALDGKRTITTSLPRAGRATVRSQPQHKRDVVHLLHANPAQRGTLRDKPIQPIQDLIALHNTQVSVATVADVAKVSLIPDGTELEYSKSDGAISFEVAEFLGHQMIEITYK